MNKGKSTYFYGRLFQAGYRRINVVYLGALQYAIDLQADGLWYRLEYPEDVHEFLPVGTAALVERGPTRGVAEQAEPGWTGQDLVAYLREIQAQREAQ
jgi:hypothetical protein